MSKPKIPILDLSPEIDALWDDLQTAIAGVLRSGQFIMGPNVKAFEQEVAHHLGAKHAVGVNSGTDALFIGLKALGIGPGDEVITTPFTFFATAEAISHVGATPVFVDIDPVSFNIDLNQVEKAVTPKTKAIIPVHLFGQAVDMEALMTLARRHNLQVVEDCAQAFGAESHERKVGTIGDVGAFSFFPTKNLGTYGDGGLLVTNRDDVADVARMLRAHGSKKKYHNEMVGYNSRLDEIQAAILRVKLPRIQAANQGRREAARRYGELLADVPGVTAPVVPEEQTHVFHQYTVRITGAPRDVVQQRLAEAGVGTMVYYPVPVHKLPVYEALGCSLPGAEQAAAQVLSLPIWPEITLDVQTKVVEALRAALEA